MKNKNNCPYKIKDTEGNIFVFSGYENGYPVYSTRGGSKHIFENEFKFYEIIEQEVPRD